MKKQKVMKDLLLCKFVGTWSDYRHRRRIYFELSRSKFFKQFGTEILRLKLRNKTNLRTMNLSKQNTYKLRSGLNQLRFI